jgi:pimeloyl-ACP methyl ester carboxylesterase
MQKIAHHLPGLVLTAHTFTVPLDHARPNGEQISVFAREVVTPAKEDAELPWLVFFQGGPGFGAPRPLTKSGWLKRALEEYRILLLDQRGTGRSTPITYQTLARLGSPQAQADYLKHFRADAIVQDAEWIRRELLGKDGRWTVRPTTCTVPRTGA